MPAIATSTKTKRRYQIVTEEKAGGATYTPAILADFVADKMLELWNPSPETVKVLDPAIGDGQLLLSLLERLTKKTTAPILVYGFDTDALALAQAKQRIQARFPNARLHLQHKNFLQHVLDAPASHALPLFQEPSAPEKFELIIANPPYVRTQIMGAEQAQILADAFGLAGRVDLYQAFLIAIARVLCVHGIAGLIVSNRFMTTKGGAALRSALRAKFSLRHVWDLGDTKLFGAAVLPAVIVAEGRNGEICGTPAFTSVYETNDQAIAEASDAIAALSMSGIVALRDGRRFRVQHGELDTSGNIEDLWRIATAESDSWLATVAKHTWRTFRDIGKIRVGVKTCADKIFIRSDWHTLPESQRPELLRPLITHHSAGRFRSIKPKKARAILYPHESESGQRRPADLSRNPNSSAYLEAHRSALEARTYVIQGGRRWYELWVPQDPAAWAAPKLVFRDISERPTFWLDFDGCIVNGDCYWLIPDREGDEDALWLAAAVANSTFIEAFYDHRFNNKLYAGRRRFITQYVEQFPLPDLNTPLAREIVKTARAIYDRAGTCDVAAIEAKLDEMVWRAFGLRVEEVRR